VFFHRGLDRAGSLLLQVINDLLVLIAAFQSSQFLVSDLDLRQLPNILSEHNQITQND
jgi:hypothetical protein